MGRWTEMKQRARDVRDVLAARRDGYRDYRSLRQGAEAYQRLSDTYQHLSGAHQHLFDAHQQLLAELESMRCDRDSACRERDSARNERERILRSLEIRRIGKAPLPPGLRGRQLCFLHIGKTAGTSVQHALFEIMQGTAILHESLPNFDTVTAAEVAINDMVIGHFGYQHVAKLRADRFLMTFLRDPVERVISNYHFLRTDSPTSKYSERAITAAMEMTLSEFLRCDEPGVRMVTENFQAKALAFDIRPEHQSATGDLYREAAQNLSSFDFVGIVEYFSESILALSNALGREVPIKRLNTTSERSSASAVAPDDLALIRQLNAVDIALYTAARAKFEQTILPELRPGGAAAARVQA